MMIGKEIQKEKRGAVPRMAQTVRENSSAETSTTGVKYSKEAKGDSSDNGSADGADGHFQAFSNDDWLECVYYMWE